MWLTVLLWLIDDVMYNTGTIIYQKSTTNSTSSVKLFFESFCWLNTLRPNRTWWLNNLTPTQKPQPQSPKLQTQLNNLDNLRKICKTRHSILSAGEFKCGSFQVWCAHNILLHFFLLAECHFTVQQVSQLSQQIIVSKGCFSVGSGISY